MGHGSLLHASKPELILYLLGQFVRDSKHTRCLAMGLWYMYFLFRSWIPHGCPMDGEGLVLSPWDGHSEALILDYFCPARIEHVTTSVA